MSAIRRYSGKVSKLDEPRKRERGAEQVGLCARCVHMRQIESDRGSIFYLCQLSATDASYPKYPRLPVLRCAGYKPAGPEEENEQVSL